MRLRWASSAVFAARHCIKFVMGLQLRGRRMSSSRDSDARALRRQFARFTEQRLNDFSAELQSSAHATRRSEARRRMVLLSEWRSASLRICNRADSAWRTLESCVSMQRACSRVAALARGPPGARFPMRGTGVTDGLAGSASVARILGEADCDRPTLRSGFLA